MRITKTNSAVIAKVIKTLSRLEQHKGKLDQYFTALSPEGTKLHLGRLPQLLLTHFTSLENAVSIIHDRQISLKQRPYISLTTLHPLEFDTVTSSKRRFGFSFFAEDLISQNLDLFSPVTYLKPDGIAATIQSASSSLADQLLCEPTQTQPSVRFMNMMEVRSLEPISIEHCALFFRESELPAESKLAVNDAGIFQLPYSVTWFRDHYVSTQTWYYSEEGDYVELSDSRANEQDCPFTAIEVIDKLKRLLNVSPDKK